MAVRIPESRERTVTQRANPAAFQQIDTPSAAFGSVNAEALKDAGTAAQKLGAQLNERTLDLAKENNELAALKYQGEIEQEMNKFLFDPQAGLMTKKGADALGSDQAVAAKLLEIKTRYDQVEGVPPDVRNMLSKSMIDMQSRYGNAAQRHQFDQYQSYKEETLTSQMALNAETVALNYTDEKQFTTKWTETQDLLKSQARAKGWSESTLKLESQKEYSKLRNAQFIQMRNTNDPEIIMMGKKAFDEAKAKGMLTFADQVDGDRVFNAVVPAAAARIAYNGLKATNLTEQDEIINFVIDDLEGGARVARDGTKASPNAIAKFGINSAANPDQKVGELTREQATELYKTRYWDAVDADNLPDNMKLLAMNASVNMGPTKAKELLSKADNDPSKFLMLTNQFYKQLAQNDPAQYGKHVKGWDMRVQKIANQFNGEVSTSVAQARAQKLEAEYPGAGTELLELVKKDQATREAAKTKEKSDIETAVQQHNADNGGDWTTLPTSLREAAVRNGIDVTTYKGVDMPDVTLELDAMPSSQFYQTNLDDPKYKQGLTFKKLEEYKLKQTELSKPDSKYLGEMIDGTVAYYFKAQGAGDPTEKGNKAKVAAMRNYVLYKAQAYRDAPANKNRNPERADINKFAAEYLTVTKNTAGIDSPYVLSDFTEEQRTQAELGVIKSGQDVNETSVLTALINAKNAGFIE